jgi:hypothetical protein
VLIELTLSGNTSLWVPGCVARLWEEREDGDPGGGLYQLASDIRHNVDLQLSSFCMKKKAFTLLLTLAAGSRPLSAT